MELDGARTGDRLFYWVFGYPRDRPVLATVVRVTPRGIVHDSRGVVWNRNGRSRPARYSGPDHARLATEEDIRKVMDDRRRQRLQSMLDKAAKLKAHKMPMDQVRAITRVIEEVFADDERRQHDDDANTAGPKTGRCRGPGGVEATAGRFVQSGLPGRCVATPGAEEPSAGADG